MNINLEELESLVKSDCYFYLGFAWNKFSYENYMPTRYQFEQLRASNLHLHEQLKDAGMKAQAKWSNELKNKFTPHLEPAQCLPAPMQLDLTLARFEEKVSCAGFLNQVGQVQKLKQNSQL